VFEKISMHLAHQFWLARLLLSQIQLHRSSEGVDFYTPVRHLAVKRMYWKDINEKLGTVTEVGKLGCTSVARR